MAEQQIGRHQHRDRQADDQAAPNHRLARPELLQQLLSDADEGNDRDRIAKCQHPGCLRREPASQLHQHHRHQQHPGDTVQQEI